MGLPSPSIKTLRIILHVVVQEVCGVCLAGGLMLPLLTFIKLNWAVQIPKTSEKTEQNPFHSASGILRVNLKLLFPESFIKCNSSFVCMKADILYSQLEKDFIKKPMHDEWFRYMKDIAGFISKNFKKRSMGVVCDFADEIKRAYTAVFPSDRALRYILKKEAKDAILFVHHAATWDIRNAPEVWTQMNKDLLRKLKENRVSIYNLHVPLDSYGRYSTGTSLAKAMNLKVEKPFARYRGALCGVICSTKAGTVKELKKSLESAVSHKVKAYN